MSENISRQISDWIVIHLELVKADEVAEPSRIDFCGLNVVEDEIMEVCEGAECFILNS